MNSSVFVAPSERKLHEECVEALSAGTDGEGSGVGPVTGRCFEVCAETDSGARAEAPRRSAERMTRRRIMEFWLFKQGRTCFFLV